ncbi:HAD hydrolase family protein [Mycoplasma struthionis]|uniref:HAD hydrolase family protein n=1 Tax=Mycoplasma struthionis TaxID=538220 RepID=UPI0021BD1C05|nr:HAD hydrolase family protein [Mycoplasma struthionis]
MNIDLKTTNDKKPVIFSDVDGTIYRLFDLKKEVIKDVEFALSQGADFNICTGNPVQQRMFWLIDELKANYLIGSSGAQIYDCKNSKIVKSWHINKSLVNEVVKIAKENNIQGFLWDDNQYFYLLEEKRIKNEVFEYHFFRWHNSPKLSSTFYKRWFWSC